MGYNLKSPRIPREHNRYHGYTYVSGTPNCPLEKKILPKTSSHLQQYPPIFMAIKGTPPKATLPQEIAGPNSRPY